MPFCPIFSAVLLERTRYWTKNFPKSELSTYPHAFLLNYYYYFFLFKKRKRIVVVVGGVDMWITSMLITDQNALDRPVVSYFVYVDNSNKWEKPVDRLGIKWG